MENRLKRFSELLALKEEVLLSNLFLVKEHSKNNNSHIKYSSKTKKDPLQYTLKEHEDWERKMNGGGVDGEGRKVDPLEKELNRLKTSKKDIETFSSNLRKRTDPSILQERAAAARHKKEKWDSTADVTSINERNRVFNKKLERE